MWFVFIPSEEWKTRTLTVGFHSAGCVDGVSEETVAWHLATHNPGHNWSGVDSNPETVLER